MQISISMREESYIDHISHKENQNLFYQEILVYFLLLLTEKGIVSIDQKIGSQKNHNSYSSQCELINCLWIKENK